MLKTYINQDKSYAPHIICRSYVEGLRNWKQDKRLLMPFGIPMVWREPKNHIDDCYFCMVNISGYNKQIYPNLLSAVRPIPHSPELPVPAPSDTFETVSNHNTSVDSVGQINDDEDFQHRSISNDLFSQCELNDLIRDLALTKEEAEILGSRLKEKNLFAQSTIFYWYRNCEMEF